MPQPLPCWTVPYKIYLPLPKYVSFPAGPLMSTVSPISRESKYWDIFPPSGYLGWTFLK